MFKKVLLHGVFAGLLSGGICFTFASVLKNEFMYDFSLILTTVKLFSACIFACILASVSYFGIKKLIPKQGDIVFNILYTIVVFASLFFPMMHKLPLDFDEYLTVIFPTYAMTLHFFPALIWLTTKPLFIKK